MVGLYKYYNGEIAKGNGMVQLCATHFALFQLSAL